MLPLKLSATVGGQGGSPCRAARELTAIADRRFSHIGQWWILPLVR
jgi:hypothetical protein